MLIGFLKRKKRVFWTNLILSVKNNFTMNIYCEVFPLKWRVFVIIYVFKNYKQFSFFITQSLILSTISYSLHLENLYYLGEGIKDTKYGAALISAAKQRIMKTLSAHWCVSLLLVVDLRLYHLSWVSWK